MSESGRQQAQRKHRRPTNKNLRKQQEYLQHGDVCLNVASVCSVCLALNIHTLRGEVNTIIDFIMVSSPLERHKVPHIQIND